MTLLLALVRFLHLALEAALQLSTSGVPFIAYCMFAWTYRKKPLPLLASLLMMIHYVVVAYLTH
jgi:hypothetical protein